MREQAAMDQPRLVVVGNGMAGCRTLEELLAIAPDLYRITVFGAEPHGNYNRIQLSPVLAGETTLDAIMLNDLGWYARHGIELHAGRRIVAIDRRRRRVVADDGSEAPYDRLLLATGAQPILLPVPGHDLPGVLAYRTIADTQAMIDAAAPGRRAVVVGGGLLGLEAAHGLRARGMEVSVVHLAPWLMERQLDRDAAALLQRSLESRGLRFEIGRRTAALRAGADGRVAALQFDDGTELAAELVVMAVGIRPDTELARAGGLHCERGIVVDDTMQTYDPRIYAVGECVQHRGATYGLVAPLFEQARVAANHLGEFGSARYRGSTTSTKLKVTGIDVFSAGDFGLDAEAAEATEARDEIVVADRAGGVYKKLVLQDDKLVGAVMVGETADSAWYLQLLREGQSVAGMRDALRRGQPPAADAGHQGRRCAAAIPDGFEVCGCNGVTKGTIVRAIKEQGLFTLEDVRRHTKASASCGSCSGLVEQILASVVGGAYAPQDPATKPLCGCTDYTHEEVRRAIRDNELVSVGAVMRFCEWRSADGCPTCRPALNYYVRCAWPLESRDDPRSRHVNERMHANIQKDGTFSVVPRIAGGVTSPAQLRRIAEVAEQYAVPAVKITGGQRIDLLGVRGEDLPRVWADLGMGSGFAYGKALRTVKTCVGSEWCRFGVQDSTALGVALENALDRMAAPHKVKLAVSGCPRNCAEAGIKDVGIVGVDSGWEIYVGGNGGIKTEVAQFLVKVGSAEEATEHVAAFLQLYREQARYLERTAHWLARVGLASVKPLLDDADQRRALAARLREALAVESDPWRQRLPETLAAAPNAGDYAPIVLHPRHPRDPEGAPDERRLDAGLPA